MQGPIRGLPALPLFILISLLRTEYSVRGAPYAALRAAHTYFRLGHAPRLCCRRPRRSFSRRLFCRRRPPSQLPCIWFTTQRPESARGRLVVGLCHSHKCNGLGEQLLSVALRLVCAPFPNCGLSLPACFFSPPFPFPPSLASPPAVCDDPMVKGQTCRAPSGIVYFREPRSRRPARRSQPARARRWLGQETVRTSSQTPRSGAQLFIVSMRPGQRLRRSVHGRPLARGRLARHLLSESELDPGNTRSRCAGLEDDGKKVKLEDLRQQATSQPSPRASPPPLPLPLPTPFPPFHRPSSHCEYRLSWCTGRLLTSYPSEVQRPKSPGCMAAPRRSREALWPLHCHLCNESDRVDRPLSRCGLCMKAWHKSCHDPEPTDSM